MTIQQYIDSVAKRYASGISSEHTYRSDLEVLLRNMVTTVEVTNEPANVTDCGNPDYVITKGKIPIGVGFGVSTPDDVKKYVKAGADAVIVGSAYLKLIEKTSQNQLETKIASFTKSLKKQTII